MNRAEPRHPGGDLLVCCSIGFLCFFGAYMRIPVLPLFAAALGADAPQVGWINAAFMLSAGVLAIPFGLLSDRLGQRPLLLGGLLTIACSSLLIPLSSKPLTMAAIYLLFGSGLAAFTPTMMSFVADSTPPSHLGRAYSLYTTAVYLGMTGGPAIGGLLGRLLGLPQVFWISGGTVALALPLLLAFLARRPPPARGAGTPPVRRTLGRLLRNRCLAACLLGTLGGCFGFGMFVSFMPLQGQAAGLNPGDIGLVFSAQALANVVLRIPFGRLSDRIDRGAMSAAGLLLLAVSLMGVGWCRGFEAMTAWAAVIGIGMGISFTALGALVAQVVSRGERGIALGLYNSCIYLGMMLSSALMGSVVHRAGFGWGFFLAGGGTLLTAVLFFTGYRRAANPEPAEKPA